MHGATSGSVECGKPSVDSLPDLAKLRRYDLYLCAEHWDEWERMRERAKR